MQHQKLVKNVDKMTLGKVCPVCHYVVPVHDRFCYHCGLNFQKHARCAVVDAGKHSFPTMKDRITCPKCHRQVSVTNRYCNYCGHDLLKK